MEIVPRQNIHYGTKNADLAKLLFTSYKFCAKLSLFQKDIRFGCFFGYPKKAERHAFLPAAPFPAACVFGEKKGDGQYEHDGFEAQAEKEDSGFKRFFV